MSTHHCCDVATADAGHETFTAQSADNGAKPSLFIRRCRSAAEWMIPGAILALLPKCPLCLAAYLALVTGVGFSMSTLIYLRTALVVLCVVSLLYLTVRSIRRLVK